MPGKNDTACTMGHSNGEHNSSCVPPADPGNLDLRLLRTIYGLCPDCNQITPHEHEETP
jgi:hypothetical protein